MVTLQISCLRYGVYTILVLKFFRPPWDSKVKTPVYNATDSIDLVYRYPLSIFAICASKSFLTHGLIAHCIVLYNRRCMCGHFQLSFSSVCNMLAQFFSILPFCPSFDFTRSIFQELQVSPGFAKVWTFHRKFSSSRILSEKTKKTHFSKKKNTTSSQAHGGKAIISVVSRIHKQNVNLNFNELFWLTSHPTDTIWCSPKNLHSAQCSR